MIELPRFVTKSRKLVRECLSGIIDADGAVLLLKKKGVINYPRISLTMSNEPLMRDIDIQLRRLGFRTTFYKRRRFDKRTRKYRYECQIDMNGWEMLKHWVNEIGTRNTLHEMKVQNIRKLTLSDPNKLFNPYVNSAKGD